MGQHVFQAGQRQPIEVLANDQHGQRARTGVALGKDLGRNRGDARSERAAQRVALGGCGARHGSAWARRRAAAHLLPDDHHQGAVRRGALGLGQFVNDVNAGQLIASAARLPRARGSGLFAGHRGIDIGGRRGCEPGLVTDLPSPAFSAPAGVSVAASSTSLKRRAWPRASELGPNMRRRQDDLLVDDLNLGVELGGELGSHFGGHFSSIRR